MRISSSDSSLEAAFVPEAGMVCSSLRYRGEELLGLRDGLEAYAKTGKTMGIPLLHPWANRLGAWEYEALGVSVELPRGLVRADSATGLPNHGTLPREWRVVGDGAAELDGASEAFPFPHTMRLDVAVREDVLRIVATLTAHDGPVPVCFGFHPYFVLPDDDPYVELPVARRLVLSEQQVPTGETEDVEPFAGPLDRTFDDGYDRLTGGPFVLAGGGRRIAVSFDEGFPVAQVYAPGDPALICFEPMTAPVDALRVGGYAVAEPGRPYRAAFSVRLTSTE